ncbi:tetratricopeptide repeat protein [Halodesulfovibrio aestuarii]|uniref:Tfp pilus assembly protein PilF n=1 Tax=Halodesulfovibrio aestuarii TaxID=126333 RepID=A0A8G2FBX6_9BACT|nr:tetratricopeptide repeat protein [Halodesulfovibrio aestuarii]SHJ48522.1 Tfp pilus assembly protein PilF [Halodesulfovibrio aestuarii]
MELHEGASNEDRKPIKGIFSTQEVKQVDTGTGVRKSVQKTFWFVEEVDGKVEVQPLNSNYIPAGKKRFITVEDVIRRFQPEPEFYVSTVFPKMQELADTVDRADAHRSSGENFTAEFEYGNALQVDEENVRANFGLGLTYLDRGETSKANNIFERLVKLDAAFETKHKHLFNEFGISLRKNKMTKQALEYYDRALELSGGDDHLFYNIARAHFEKKDYAKCVDFLLKAVNSNPDFEVVLKFFVWLLDKGLVPEARLSEVRTVVRSAEIVANRKEAVAEAVGDGIQLEQRSADESTPVVEKVIDDDDDDLLLQ